MRFSCWIYSVNGDTIFIERLQSKKGGAKRCSEKNMWKEYTEIQQKELEELSVRYKECLDIGKTERECVKLGKKMADTWGYKNLEDCISGEPL